MVQRRGRAHAGWRRECLAWCGQIGKQRSAAQRGRAAKRPTANRRNNTQQHKQATNNTTPHGSETDTRIQLDRHAYVPVRQACVKHERRVVEIGIWLRRLEGEQTGRPPSDALLVKLMQRCTHVDGIAPSLEGQQQASRLVTRGKSARTGFLHDVREPLHETIETRLCNIFVSFLPPYQHHLKIKCVSFHLIESM